MNSTQLAPSSIALPWAFVLMDSLPGVAKGCCKRPIVAWPAIALGLGGWSDQQMHINFRNKDFWAGMMLITIGGGAGLIARGYPFGTSLRMGAGYFPIVLSGILVVFGLCLMARAIKSTESIEGNWSIRGLIILPVTLALFGFLLDRAGFIPAMFVIVIGSALASKEFKLLEVLALSVFLTAASVAVFIWGLGLPYQLIVGL